MERRVERPPTLASVSAQKIKEIVLQGELEAGDPLREAELARQLGVGTGTIREALRMLTDEGLVELKPHLGVFVVELSEQTVSELFTLRTELEGFALRLGMEKGAYTQDTIDQFEGLLRSMDTAQNSGRMYELFQLDVDFHHLIGQKAGHDLLSTILRSLETRTLLFLRNIVIYEAEDLTTMAESASHSPIVEALRVGDSKQALAALREHIENSGLALLNTMRARSDEVVANRG